MRAHDKVARKNAHACRICYVSRGGLAQIGKSMLAQFRDSTERFSKSMLLMYMIIEIII
jgi:hypothetical protein